MHGDQRLYLLVWLVIFFFSTYGEELLWRGDILSCMEVAIGKVAWLFNGSFWLMFHFCLGLQQVILPATHSEQWRLTRTYHCKLIRFQIN